MMSVPNVEVVSAVTGESIAVFEKEEFADASVKVLKQRLAQQIGIPRFRLRLLQDNSPLDDDQNFGPRSCAACENGVSGLLKWNQIGKS